MSLRDLYLATNYETTEHQTELLDTFYIPVLEQSTKYYRIAGFFSSSSLAVAAKGIESLIKNNGRMYLLVSPELSEEDYRIIKEHGTITEDISCFSNLDLEKAVNENLQALAWLLDCGRLEIKIVVAKQSPKSLFHQKVGIVFDDEGNMISFSGSINETAQAWLQNIEEFKVFRSWEDGQIEYLQSDLAKFLSYWKNEKQEIADVYDIPSAVKQKIVQIKPRDVMDLNIMRRYRKDKKTSDNKLSLFPHQERAVNAWINNNYSLLMEMATGTGKTRTAIGCMLELLKDKVPTLFIVATPQNTLSRQWKTDVDKLGIAFDHADIIDGSNPKWRKSLEFLLQDLSDKNIQNAVIYTTHDTSSSDKFISIVKENKYDTRIVFVCDEVHAIGSAKQRKALLEEYECRIGLSATPQRMFDEAGTQLIVDYFGKASFEFTIADALSTINPLTGKPFLNRFYYYPIFVNLSEKEEADYAKISRQIAVLLNDEDRDEQKLQRLYDRRADICKNAIGKYDALDVLLEGMDPNTIEDTILFVSDAQIVPCFDILSQKKIRRAKITERESATKVVDDQGDTERQAIISQFVNHQIQMLVGIKCLDEGIDIPNARIAILMSSSTNPREYVQRVGRVIRQAPNKKESAIYDFIAKPSCSIPSVANILVKEARRAAYIAQNAINFEEVKEKFLENGVEINADQ